MGELVFSYLMEILSSGCGRWAGSMELLEQLASGIYSLGRAGKVVLGKQ